LVVGKNKIIKPPFPLRKTFSNE